MLYKVHQRISNIINILAVLIAFCGLGYGFYTRNKDKTAEFYEKEAQEREEIRELIQSIDKGNKKALEDHKNDFNKYILKNQEVIFQHDKKIESLEAKADHLKNQNEYLHTQTKTDNNILKSELKSWTEKHFKKDE
jgi:hypothetical protein